MVENFKTRLRRIIQDKETGDKFFKVDGKKVLFSKSKCLSESEASASSLAPIKSAVAMIALSRFWNSVSVGIERNT